MAEQVLSDCKCWLDGWDLSGDLNALALEHSVEEKPAPTFGAGTIPNLAGLKIAAASLDGLFEGGTDNVDDALAQNLGLADVPLTIDPQDGSVGDVVYFFKALQATYSPIAGVSVGDPATFSMRAGVSSGPLVRGTLMEQSSKSSTADGTARQLGAVGAAQKIYGALHVISASGSSPTIDVTVESDAADDFTGSETARLTFAQQTGIGSDWQELAGAITDDWWRVTWTLGGTSPSFGIVVALGII